MWCLRRATLERAAVARRRNAPYVRNPVLRCELAAGEAEVTWLGDEFLLPVAEGIFHCFDRDALCPVPEIRSHSLCTFAKIESAAAGQTKGRALALEV